LHQRALAAAGGRTSEGALRLALDAVVAALALGERCVEGVRRLATSSATALLLTSRAPSPTWMRRVLSRFAEEALTLSKNDPGLLSRNGPPAP
ncbi:MAG: hypothetical protein L0Y64_11480, partial [Myxococcaceae bacterium]|nr:hypothetical protein [Myxococcaceae bacterium]